MEGKKRYIAIVLFLLIGLTLFAFANPVEEENGLDKTNGNGKDTSEVSDRKDNNEDNAGTLEVEDNDNAQTQAPMQNQQNNQQDDNTYASALAAVERAEQALANEFDSNAVKELLEDARELIDAVTNNNSKNELTERADIVEEAIDAISLVEALEKLVNDAENKDEINEAIDYRTDNQVNETVDNLRNKEVQKVLKDILDKLNLILDDNTAPSYDGIKNNETTKEDVTLIVSDDTEVTVKVTLNGEEVTYTEGKAFAKEGVYEVVLIDEAFNETPITFTIDKTAPKFEGLKSGSHYEKIEIKVNDATETKITVENKDTGETTVVENGTVLTEDATYYITAEDAAGNKTSIYVAIDTTAPEITGIDETKPTNKNEIVYVSDKFLKTVTIDGVEYTREDFTVGENNENFKFQKKVTHEGTHTVVATDKYGNTTTKTFVIDKTPNKVMWTSIKTTNKNVEGNIYYVKNGDTITFRMGTSEKFGENPIVTIGGRTVEMKYVKYFAGPKHHEYMGTLEIAADETEMVEGTLEISISNVTDEAGNKGFVYQKGNTKDTISTKVTTNGKTLIYDRTETTRVYSTVRVNKTEYNEDGTKYYYVKNGDSFEFAMSFSEKLAEAPVVTIGGRKVEMKLNEKVLNNENKVLYEGTFKIAEDESKLEEGILEIKVSNVKDLAGNESTQETVLNQTRTSNGRTVIYDRSEPVRKSADFYVSGLTQVEKTFYTQYGKTVVVNITTDEILAEIPTFTLHNNGNDYGMTGAIYRGLNDKGYHLYQASFDITEDTGMTDGEITFTISNIVDRAGNRRKDLTEPSNGRKVVLDNEVAVDKLAIIGKNGQWKDKEYIQYANNGTTIYVNARFYEELVETPTVTLNEKVTATLGTKKFDEKSKVWIYSYRYNVTDKLEDGTIKVIVTNIKDYAGNTTTLTNEHMLLESQSEVIIDNTLPTYRFTKAGSSLAKDEIKPIEKDGVLYFEEAVRLTLSDSVNLRLHGVDKYYDDKNAKRTGWLTDVKTFGEHTAVAVDAAGNRLEFKFVVGGESPAIEGNKVNITEDLTLVNRPFYNNDSATKDIIINGNGKTVTQYVTDESKFDWRENYTIPLMGNVFSSSNSSKTTVNDLTLKGTIQSVLLGNYENTNQGYFSTEFNNVNIIDTEVVSLSANISPGAVVYGTAVLNNTNIYGTKLSSLDTDPMWPVYDLALVNFSNTTINKGKYGSIYTWAKAYLEINNAEIDTIISQCRKTDDFKDGGLVIGASTSVKKISVKNKSAVITIKSGATVETLDFNGLDQTNMTIIIEDGATVKNIIA